MKRGRTPLTLSLLGLGVLVCASFFVPTATIHAQSPQPGTVTTALNCNSTPRDSRCSYDPKVNPLLIAMGLDYIPSASKTPSSYPNYGQCVRYSKQTLGCIDSKGVFIRVVTTSVLSPSDIPGDTTTNDTITVYYPDGSTTQDQYFGGSLIHLATQSNASGTITGATSSNLIAETASGDSCGITNITACLVSGMAWIISEIEWLILGVAAGILGLANYLLGWSTYVTVFQFGNLVGNSAGLLAAWGVMRDVANIVLLFGFIFLGVSTILNLPHSEYTAKKAIPSLIIFALLLNFSLFAVEAVIDVSNALATSIYEQATGGAGVCDSNPDGVVGTVTNTLDCIFKQGIGGQVMAMSGMANMYGFGSGEDEAKNGNNVQLVVVYAGLIIFAVITTLVLFAAAIMLIIRAVVLAFLMVTAPIGFAGMAIPPLHEMASRWWKELISQALFAPVYFLLALLSLKIMSGVMTALGTSSSGPSRETLAGVFTAASDTGARGSNITIVMTFALIIGFMVAALMFAKKSSAMGTSMAMSGAGKLAFGSLGFIGRNSVGRFANYQASRLAKSQEARKTRIGQFALKNFAGVAKNSFDVRGSGAGKQLEGLIGSLGTAQKGGYYGTVHEAEEARKKLAKEFKNSDEEIEEIIDAEGEDGNGGAIGDLKKELAEATERHKAELIGLESRLAAQRQQNEAILAPQRQQIDAKRIELEKKEQELQAARTAGEQEKADLLETEVARARESLNASGNAYQATKDQAEKDLEPFTEEISRAKKGHADETTRINGEIKALQDRVKELKAKPQKDYADYLHEKGEEQSILNNSVTRNITGVGKHADHHASDAIKRELKKSENQKLLDALSKVKKDIDTSAPANPGAPAAGAGHH